MYNGTAILLEHYSYEVLRDVAARSKASSFPHRDVEYLSMRLFLGSMLIRHSGLNEAVLAASGSQVTSSDVWNGASQFEEPQV